VKLIPYGEAALLVETGDLDRVLALYRRLVAAGLEGVTDLVPSAHTLLVQVDVHRTSLARVARDLEDLDATDDPPEGQGEVEVPVVYDGQDLEEVGELTGLGPEGVVAAHTEQRWTVGFVGFAPGFGYLVGQDERLQVPRRSQPRTTVPVGAVGLADRFSGVYPRRSPGGWQLIGRTEVAVWNLERDPPALLQPGTVVRFVEAR
jgi:KipI family sensor histidine kinase inhibitor